MPDDARNPSTALAVHAQGGGGMLTDASRFEFGQRVANLFAASQLVPAHLRGKPQDCFIALHMAERLNEDPLIVMQNIYIVSGKAGWSAQYMIGRANRSGVFRGRITWKTEGTGDALKVTACATLAETGEVVEASASMAMAKAEGWVSNKKYQSMPEHMLRFRSATMLIRLYAPEVMLGIPTADEVEDEAAAGRGMRDVTPPAAATAPAAAGPRDAFEAAAAGEVVDVDPAPAPEAPAVEAEPKHATRAAKPATAPKPPNSPLTAGGNWPAWTQWFLGEIGRTPAHDVGKLLLDHGAEVDWLETNDPLGWADIQRAIDKRREEG
jgi:hypothetical protein